MNPTTTNELSPLVDGLLRWTWLLACAWFLDGFLRHRHARSRVILWRVVLVLTLALPWWQRLPGPAWSVRISPPVAESIGLPVEEPAVIARPIPEGRPQPPLAASRVKANPNLDVVEAGRREQVRGPQSASEWLGLLWALGALTGVFRLACWHRQLDRLCRESTPAGQEFAGTVAAIGAQFGLRTRIDTRISAHTRSPFICGFWRPQLLLPEAWLQELSPPEIKALLRHELAHLRGQDLRWTIAWRWFATLAWFQPLVWFVPRVHQLACEQEADRLAAGAAEHRTEYAALLARMALRVLALPPMETKLALNASSDLVRRLNHLGKGEPRSWRPRHSVLAALGAALMLQTAINWRMSVSSWAAARGQINNTFEKVRVTVLSEDGKAIEGAVIQPDGLRHHQNRASHYPWQTARVGKASPVTTDAQGQATILYPRLVIPEENLRTIQISFSVNHPDFSPVRPTEYPVDGTAGPVRMSPGARIEVSGYHGPSREPILELIPNLSAEIKVNWQDHSDGRFTCDQQAPGGKLLQLMGRLPGGEIVFSDTVSFRAEAGRTSSHQLELKPGIRLKGRIDARVPRPVNNGRVVIGVRPKEFPALEPNQFYALRKTHGYFHFWSSYRPIDADGSFVFESIPPGEVDLIVHGNGFCSRQGQLLPANYVPPKDFGVPQTFPLASPVTEITVATESTVTVRLTAKTRGGQPLAGATVYFNPNLLLIPVGIFGETPQPGEGPFRTLPKLPTMPYRVTTDDKGIAVAENLPAFTSSLGLWHADFVLPIVHGDRSVRFERKLIPGANEEVSVTVEPKGRRLLGNR